MKAKHLKIARAKLNRRPGRFDPPLAKKDQEFDLILMDAPWLFSSNSRKKPGRNAVRHYPCMTDAEIAAMPVDDFAAKDCLLFYWTTAPMLWRAIQIPQQWGFKYVTELTWPKDKAGLGFWARNQHEPCLLFKRGKFPCPKPAPFASSLIEGLRREHSQKPESLQDRIDEIWPEARKLEMFARRHRPGWTAWGNDTQKFDEEERENRT